MFNLPQNNQQLVPMGMQQQPIANMPVQNIQTYIPAVQNMPQTDTFINVGNQQQQTGKGFWEGFKSVFAKIGEFCSDNFGLLLTGAALLGGYKFCSSSMNSYEENKKEGRLNENGSFNESENPSLKETVMNFVGYGVHSIFGSSQAGDVKNDKPLSKSEKAKLEKMVNENKDALNLLLQDYINQGSISNVLQFDNPIIKICALEVIQEKFNDIKDWSKFKRPETIVNTLNALSDTSVDTDIRRRAINVATKLKNKDYFNTNQQKILKGISEIKIEKPKEEEKVDTKD